MKVGYRFLHLTLMYQWKPKGEIIMADMGNDFYLLQFTTEEDYKHVLYDGPWLVADHVLIVRKWQPRFDPDEATIDRAVLRVQIPKLYREYYDHSILFRVACRVGRPIKVDEVTLRATRVKYGRVCVEVDLPKPLLSKFYMHRRVWKLVYGGLDSNCFMCGHTLDSCQINPNREAALTSMETHTELAAPIPPTSIIEVSDDRPELSANHGPWMIAQKKRRGRPKGLRATVVDKPLGTSAAPSGSRFALLSEHTEPTSAHVTVTPPALSMAAPIVAPPRTNPKPPTPVVQITPTVSILPSNSSIKGKSHVSASVPPSSSTGSVLLRTSSLTPPNSSAPMSMPLTGDLMVPHFSGSVTPPAFSSRPVEMEEDLPPSQPVSVSSPPKPPDRGGPHRCIAQDLRVL
ncbi:hypothetical protein Tsubulata_024172 [Turnera subulata]|uniref:DUF4283 domain-containing protein n=1 Tax=Turnera subulata TaxID=218843 RepID=A0A9Q0GBD6_9ROSI|nr:hypothetical protein Tsubulata_024172 [Turnera subulata]